MTVCCTIFHFFKYCSGRFSLSKTLSESSKSINRWPEFHLILPLPTSLNIVVWSPLPRTRVVNNQRIEDQARAFEANVLHQLRDANGIIVSGERATKAVEGPSIWRVH
ncbi:hypothetical protein CV093_14290 [Oceanobacillus sp. 143]|nr:hypothetical protein CV093_14290 [Oceanobacillus sp. 143]